MAFLKAHFKKMKAEQLEKAKEKDEKKKVKAAKKDWLSNHTYWILPKLDDFDGGSAGDSEEEVKPKKVGKYAHVKSRFASTGRLPKATEEVPEPLQPIKVADYLPPSLSRSRVSPDPEQAIQLEDDGTIVSWF